MEKSKRNALVVGIIISICALSIGTYHCQSGVRRGAGGEVQKNILRKDFKIKTEVKDKILFYQENRIWREGYFRAKMKNRSAFASDLIQQFNDTYDVDVKSLEVEFFEENKSTSLMCEVPDKISESRSTYKATFLWFLNPHSLDFIDDNFRESKTSLSWKGELGGVSAKIIIDLPPQDSVYKDWGHPIGHCHGHVWWPK